jgi:N-carbamoylputrescine amidase
MRQVGLLGADIVFIPQAGAVGEWPSGLYEAELQVAGFQNGYYTALCNRVGKESCLSFEGKSFVSGPDGRIIVQAPPMEDAILYAEIDLDNLQTCHARKHFIPDRRKDLYKKWLK